VPKPWLIICILLSTLPLATLQVCWTKYGSYPIHRPYCHEAAVRILLACLESHANRYKRYIVPLLSVHMDFYIRVRGVAFQPLADCVSPCPYIRVRGAAVDSLFGAAAEGR
jgi:hypothetical protein